MLCYVMDLTGFLFGNVNEEGELEDESVLDQESVFQLSRLGVADVLGDIVRSGPREKEEDSSGDESSEAADLDKSPTAEDFTDIAEVAEDEDSTLRAVGEGRGATPTPIEGVSATPTLGEGVGATPMLGEGGAPPVPGSGKIMITELSERERFYEKGILYAQSQFGTTSGQDDDYDMEVEEDQGYTSSLPLTATSSESYPQSESQPTAPPLPLDLTDSQQTPSPVTESQQTPSPVPLGPTESQQTPSPVTDSQQTPSLVPLSLTDSQQTPSPVPLSLTDSQQTPSPAPLGPTESQQTPSPVPLSLTDSQQTPSPVPLSLTDSQQTPSPVPLSLTDSQQAPSPVPLSLTESQQTLSLNLTESQDSGFGSGTSQPLALTPPESWFGSSSQPLTPTTTASLEPDKASVPATQSLDQMPTFHLDGDLITSNFASNMAAPSSLIGMAAPSSLVGMAVGSDSGILTAVPHSIPEVMVESLTDPPPETSAEAPAVTGTAIPALIPENMTIEELYAKVKELFPGFAPDGILRFSSLLGPGKRSSLPRIWQGAKKPKRKKKKVEGESPTEWKLEFGSTPPPEMCLSDDEDKLLAPAAPTTHQQSSSSLGQTRQSLAMVDPETSEWRFGPAKIWYDMIGVPEDGRGLDYGFKLKQPASPTSSDDEGKPPSLDDNYVPPDDAFLMVTQQNWENKILWEVPYTPGPPITGSGGVWSPLESPSTSLTQLLSRQSSGATGTTNSDGGTASSMFPIQNYDLIYRKWEDDIIWDSDAVTRIPKPSVARLDPNDPNIILGYPEEPAASGPGDKEGKKDVRKSSKLLMNKMNRSDSSQSSSSSFLGKKDPFNLSNDEYYNPKHVSSTQGLSGFSSNIVQHSIPALDLHSPWYPTHMRSSLLRRFHRPKLQFHCGREETTGYYAINTLTQHIARKEKEREKERVSSGGGEVFFMRTPEDMSACDGDILLAEYGEQHPPLIMGTGMATRIKNYYRRPDRQVKSHAPELEYGETIYIQNTSYFLGQLKPGQALQSFENNLFRAPIYHHTMPSTDFLVVVSEAGDQVYLRDVKNLFIVGQECPKVNVPAPNSKPATQFHKDYLQVFLYRLFWDSDERPRKIKMDAVRKGFPQSDISESVIRKVLKLCADFKREGYEIGFWVLRSDFRLPSDEEMRSMVSPEQVCAYGSMLSAEQRLKDTGYRGKSVFTVEEDDDDTSKVDDEVRAAPWNTTHHFINAMMGKYQLSVSGPADPTGCGEGFSYTRLNPRRVGSNAGLAKAKYKTVMGTDGDLRKLKLSKARNVLRNFGVAEEEIAKLKRWEVIDLVRTLSTEAAKSGGVDVKSIRFARGARFSQMEAQERYREECQRVFDLQNKVLSSTEVLSTDEESSSSGGESDDELGRNLETLLGGKKTSAQLSHEQEEAERQELRRLIAEDKLPSLGKGVDEVSGRGTPSGDGDDTASVRSFSSMFGRRLLISRTFCDEEGREYVRHEVVKNQAVIDGYIRLKTSRSKDVMSQFADQDEQTKETIKKEKRRLQDRLRRMNKLKERPQKPPKPKPLTTINMKCSACGQRGHMKTNKNCPKYKNNPVNVAPTDEEIAQQEASLGQDDLVKVEGTKVLLKRAVVEHAIGVRRKSLLLRFPKDKVKKRRRHGEEELDYLEKRTKSVHRRKTNPEVPFSDLLENILASVSALPESEQFQKPVQPKAVPDYYKVIKFPMDLQTMRDNCRQRYYHSREDFLEHVNLIVNNCITYNGFGSELTKNAQRMSEFCSEEMKKFEKELEKLEQKINPALDDNAQVAFSYILGKAVEAMKKVPDSWPFHVPVSAKKLPDYHRIIRRPIDLDTIKKNCVRGVYRSRDQFMVDVNQIVDNSITYNGLTNRFTWIAGRIREEAIRVLEKETDLIAKLESRIGEVASPLGSVQDSNSGELFEISQSQTNEFEIGQSQSSEFEMDQSQASEFEMDQSQASMLLERGMVGEEVVDLEEGEEGMDVLLQDLEHSSSSSDSDSESEMEDDGVL